MSLTFREKINRIVAKIPQGKFLTYKRVAELIGRPKAFRAVGNILAKNNDPKIFCHRVIRNDNLVGGLSSQKSLSWQKAALLLKDGAVGVIPTDTIYGICASAIKPKSVEIIYRLRKRNTQKPFIVLIIDIGDLKKFEVSITPQQKNLLQKIWPNPISVILKCPSPKFVYLHRGTKTLAFRLPKNKLLQNILTISGPLVAPSANWEGYPPAETINDAKKYFGSKVFYLEKPKQTQQTKKSNTRPSTLIDLTGNKIKILRRGRNFASLKTLKSLIYL